MKRVLITGKGSYIGESARAFLETMPDRYEVSVMDTFGLEPRPEQFASFDTVFNVAGIVHTAETEENRHLYYEVNRDLVAAIAAAAREAGVRQFILLSSMNVYGREEGAITKETRPDPKSAYGRSKNEADELIRAMENENFRFACLRPPMVYGKGCKGNYQRLRSFALKSPFFPRYDNARSMVYIGNLCEFVRRLIDSGEGGLFFPQNAEYVNTGEMVRQIAAVHGKKILSGTVLNPLIRIMKMDVFRKVFGTLTYEMTEPIDTFSFEESIRLTEE